MWGIWRKNFVNYDADLVKKYGKTFGFFEGRKPNLFVADAEFIRSVLVKDFDHFVNRRVSGWYVPGDTCNMWLFTLQSFEMKAKYIRKMISLIRDDEWKEVRSAVSPTFTTGKIKRVRFVNKYIHNILLIRIFYF